MTHALAGRCRTHLDASPLAVVHDRNALCYLRRLHGVEHARVRICGRLHQMCEDDLVNAGDLTPSHRHDDHPKMDVHRGAEHARVRIYADLNQTYAGSMDATMYEIQNRGVDDPTLKVTVHETSRLQRGYVMRH